MKVRYWMVFAIALFLVPTFAFAGSTCALATLVEPNGSIKDFDFVAPSSSLFYQFKVSAGHSYSAKVVQPYDDVNTDLTVTVNSENTTCNVGVATPTVTTGVEPALAANGFRESFTAPANGTYSIVVVNANASTGRYIQLEVNDTTYYNVRWSTYAGFVTQWGFQNTSNQTINVVMKATAVLGGTVSQQGSFAVGPNTEVYKIIGPGYDLNVSANLAGYAVMTNDGPPGALLVDAFFLGPGGNIVPSVFQAVRALQH